MEPSNRRKAFDLLERWKVVNSDEGTFDLAFFLGRLGVQEFVKMSSMGYCGFEKTE